MSTPKVKITSAVWWESVRHNVDLLAEYVKRAQKATKRETGHECGHTFRVTIESRGHSWVVGEGPESHRDANWWGDPWTVEVRANSLVEALAVATTVPLTEWASEDADA